MASVNSGRTNFRQRCQLMLARAHVVYIEGDSFLKGGNLHIFVLQRF